MFFPQVTKSSWECLTRHCVSALQEQNRLETAFADPGTEELDRSHNRRYAAFRQTWTGSRAFSAESPRLHSWVSGSAFQIFHIAKLIALDGGIIPLFPRSVSQAAFFICPMTTLKSGCSRCASTCGRISCCEASSMSLEEAPPRRPRFQRRYPLPPALSLPLPPFPPPPSPLYWPAPLSPPSTAR